MRLRSALEATMNNVHEIKRPQICPKCNGDSVAYFLYGLPDFNLIEKDIESGRTKLGGCVVIEECPQWHCNSCGNEWGELLEIEELRAIRKRSEEKKERQKKEAIERGVMDAYVNKHGSVKCPHCGSNFRIKYGLTEEGAHSSCGTYLNLINN